MNVGGVAPLQQRQDTGGTSSDEESVTGGGDQDKNSTEDEGLLLRAVEFCRCQQIYVESGNDKKTLFLLCIGLNVIDGDTPLLSVENEPWSRLPKSSFRPKNTDFVKEIARRAKLYNVLPVPRPSNWKRPQIIEWLEQNPIRGNNCIEFLVSEVAKLKDILVRIQQQQTDLSAGAGGAKWRGTVPYLRVIMCLTDDQVKRLFLNRANVRTRHELDGRHSENRPKTVFELICDMWNSSAFNPVAPPSECHFDFQTATDCSYELVKSLAPATPEKIEDIFVSMRSHLLRIITRWEQSGQGEGGRDNEFDADEDAEEASSAVAASSTITDNDFHDKTIALQSRAAFLNGRPSYLLYFWEIADSHQLLQSSLQRLSNSTGASDASLAPSSSSRPRRRREREEDLNDESQHNYRDAEATLLHPLVESIKDFVECQRQQLQLNSSASVNESLELEERRRVFDMKAQSADRCFRRRAELSDLARKYRKMNAEIDPNADEKSRRLSDFYVSEVLEIEKEIWLLDSSNNEQD
ncbi:hypothetical protein MHU86_22745 [Fragilaria crotonensis]|nr:hypothetical protein MHU86_22745 [Fragilaria crotonensis]